MKKLLIIGMISLITFSYGGCKINLFVKNVSDQKINIYNFYTAPTFQSKSAVKSKGGSWRALAQGGWMGNVFIGNTFLLTPNEKVGDQYAATFGCSGKRRYRIIYSCKKDTQFTKYYPSSDGWTKKQTLTINVGDLCEKTLETPKITRTFTNPTIGTRKLDWCKTWGQECGEPAATYFCQRKGMTKASTWEEDRDIGNTLVLGDNKVCDMAGCDGFKSITCVK